MRYYNYENEKISVIGLGCMRLAQHLYNHSERAVLTAIDNGVNFFDHADIYCNGKSEKMFAEILKNNKIDRSKIIIQSKCGINKKDGLFDFSKEYILNSVDGILKRLNVDYLDFFLLHRPDALFDGDEVFEAIDKLISCGKIKRFGVSNQNSYQMQLMQKYVKQRICVNQLQMSVTECNGITAGFNVNMKNKQSILHDGDAYDYCRLNDILIQAWSPLQYGYFKGSFIDNFKFSKLNFVLGGLAKKYNVSKSAIAIAWLLRLPAKIMPIVGSMNAEHIQDLLKATDVELARAEWYDIYKSVGNKLP